MLLFFLSTIPLSATISTVLSAVSAPYPDLPGRVDISRPAYALFALIIIALVVWNRHLKRLLSAQSGNLKKCSEQYREIVEKAADGILLGNREGIITGANARMEQLTGKGREELIGQHVSTLFPPECLQKAPLRFDLLLQGRTVISQRELLRPDGARISIEMHTVIMPDGTYQSIYHDITERLKSENSLRESEGRFRKIIELSPLPMAIIGMDGTIEFINTCAIETFGYLPEDIPTMQQWLELAYPDQAYRTEVQNQWATLVTEAVEQNRGIESREYRITCKDGTLKNALIFGIPVDNRIFVMLEDITCLKQAENALRESEATFRKHVENSFDVIFTLDAEGTFVFVSPAWERHFGYPPSEVIGQRFAPYVHPDDILPCVEYLTTVLSSGQGGTSPPYRVKCADGSWRSFIANGLPYVDTKGALLFIGVGHDITEQLQAEEERLDFERKLLHSQKLESMGILAGGIAHDFNNLLLAIMGNLELASLKLPPDSPAHKFLTHAVHAATHAADLTNSMLAYSGKGNFVIKLTDLNQMVEENAAMFRAAVPKTISMELHTDPHLPAIMADIAQLQQVIMNLITNAAEAIVTPPGCIRLSTGVQICDSSCLAGSRLDEKPEPGHFVYLEVSDNGCGMSEETSLRLFDPFFSTKFTGRGLGMSAVQGIVKGHGGALFVESAPGEGSAIKVLFPVADQGDGSRAVEGTSLPTPAAESAGIQLTGMALVVDDEKRVLKTCSTMVSMCGFTVITAKDGRDAVAKFSGQSDQIDVVLMDLSMPHMDGLAAMSELRRIRPDLKVILTSGFNEQELDSRINGQAPSGFIRKPFNLNELESLLQQVMHGTSQRFTQPAA